MISVLIPVFNCVIKDLVSALEHQFLVAEIPYEIVIIDDGSDLLYKEENKIVVQRKNINYIEFQNNKGRIATRNELMKKAAYDWLLFLDADSLITDTNYLKNYLQALNKSQDVIVGGRIYDKEKPANCCLSLHWTYGSQREVQLSQQRSKRSYAGFMSNNFLIRKEVFQKLQLTEELSGYGHEDTWMGVQLQKIGANVHHIDNPVLHIGLEDNKVFIEKSQNGLRNLYKLERLVGKEKLSEHVKLYAAYRRYKKLGSLSILSSILSIFEPLIIHNLNSCNPSLLLFDLYRLSYFTRLTKEAH